MFTFFKRNFIVSDFPSLTQNTIPLGNIYDLVIIIEINVFSAYFLAKERPIRYLIPYEEKIFSQIDNFQVTRSNSLDYY